MVRFLKLAFFCSECSYKRLVLSEMWKYSIAFPNRKVSIQERVGEDSSLLIVFCYIPFINKSELTNTQART